MLERLMRPHKVGMHATNPSTVSRETEMYEAIEEIDREEEGLRDKRVKVKGVEIM